MIHWELGELLGERRTVIQVICKVWIKSQNAIVLDCGLLFTVLNNFVFQMEFARNISHYSNIPKTADIVVGMVYLIFGKL